MNLIPGEKSDRARQEIHASLEVTSQRAQKFGGDPFHDYRGLKTLPEKFEYGMNCFLDRIAEERGQEVLQKVYEELRAAPDNYTIDESPGGCALVGIPVLFGIRSLSIALVVYNKAITQKTAIKTTFISTGAP